MKLSMFFSPKHFFISLAISTRVASTPLNEEENCKSFLGLRHLPDHPTVFGTNLICLAMPRFARIFSNMQKYFPNHWSIQIFFISGIGPDILMNMLEDCIVFFKWEVWVLFNFYLKLFILIFILCRFHPFPLRSLV